MQSGAWMTALSRLEDIFLISCTGRDCDDLSSVMPTAGSTKREPTVVGKPEEFMLANIADTAGLRRDQICMIGDRLDTDIQFGRDGGLTTMLVLSGESRLVLAFAAVQLLSLQISIKCCVPLQV